MYSKPCKQIRKKKQQQHDDDDGQEYGFKTCFPLRFYWQWLPFVIALNMLNIYLYNIICKGSKQFTLQTFGLAILFYFLQLGQLVVLSHIMKPNSFANSLLFLLSFCVPKFEIAANDWNCAPSEDKRGENRYNLELSHSKEANKKDESTSRMKWGQTFPWNMR